MKAQSDGGASMLIALSRCVGKVVMELLADILPNAASIDLTRVAFKFSRDNIRLAAGQ
jgi:hypothetical protein